MVQDRKEKKSADAFVWKTSVLDEEIFEVSILPIP